MPPNREDQSRAEREAAFEQTCLAIAALIAAGQYDAAEQRMRRADDSVVGGARLAQLYMEHLSQLADSGQLDRDCETVRATYQRARLAIMGQFPDPHTQVEADNYDRYRREDLLALDRLFGGQPPR